jgi:hypothetical protein
VFIVVVGGSDDVVDDVVDEVATAAAYAMWCLPSPPSRGDARFTLSM